jgi:DNA polymerase-3 subunit epsilon
MREIVLDTETTGLDPFAGHRIVEIACLELHSHVPTGETFRVFINPERDMPEEAERIHGLSAEFLAGHPVFADIAQGFLDFIGDDPLVIHNAQFDLKFLNAELGTCGLPKIDAARAIDTVAIARQRFPGAQVNLDALCRRFEIDNSSRTFHGALLDCELLADVYLELSGGRQPGLDLNASTTRQQAAQTLLERTLRPARPHSPTAEELSAHETMLGKLKEPLWNQ